jgi:methyl-accepting chemotaxis protein
MENPQAGPAYKRRIIVIKKSFQYKIVALVAGSVAVAIAAVAVDMFTALGHYVAEAQPDFDVRSIYADSATAFGVRAVIYLVGICWVSLVISHRIAGPVYRFERSAEDVAKGDLTSKIFLREGDELGDLREGFNTMVESLNQKVSASVSSAAKVRKSLEEISQDPAVPAAAAQKVRQALAEAAKIGEGFKLV